MTRHPPPDPDPADRISRLERAGILRGAREPLPIERLQRPGPVVRASASAVEAILEERRAGR